MRLIEGKCSSFILEKLHLREKHLGGKIIYVHVCRRTTNALVNHTLAEHESIVDSC